LFILNIFIQNCVRACVRVCVWRGSVGLAIGLRGFNP